MNKILRFRLVSNEVKDFYRDFEIEENATFFDLHDAIQNEVGYDKSQLASFYLTDEHWHKEREISLLDMRTGSPEDPLIMDETLLVDYIKNPKQKLVYVFDFFSGRAYFIEFIETDEKNRNRKYPCCCGRKGEPPVQIRLDIGKKSGKPKLNIMDDDEEEIGGDPETFNDDELDEEGFNEEGEEGEEGSENEFGDDDRY